MMLALVEAHEKTLGSQQSVDPSCAFIVLMCREDFSITPPGFLSNSGSLSENVATQLWTVGDLWPPGRAQKTGADDSSHGTKGALGL